MDNIYCRYYKGQLGGEFPIFQGGQHGAGLGDILRGIFRFIAPIAIRGISTFASNTLDAHQKGSDLKTAALGALRPALGAMASAASNSLSAKVKEQSGSGSALFRGKDGVPFEDALTHYKKGKHRGKAPKKRKSSFHKKSVEANF